MIALDAPKSIAPGIARWPEMAIKIKAGYTLPDEIAQDIGFCFDFDFQGACERCPVPINNPCPMWALVANHSPEANPAWARNFTP